MNNWIRLKPLNRGGIKQGELVTIWPVLEDIDEIVHCTGTVTEYELNALRTRIANGMTTADDVDLFDKVIKYGVHPATG